eukprot:494065-Amphidinium_carterae.2
MQKAVTSSGTRDLEEPLVESEATTELLSGVLVELNMSKSQPRTHERQRMKTIERFKKFFLYDILVLAYTVGVVLAFLFNINFALSGSGCVADLRMWFAFKVRDADSVVLRYWGRWYR